VVDFRGAPPPPEVQILDQLTGGALLGGGGSTGTGGTAGAAGTAAAAGTAGTATNLPDGANENTIAQAFQASPAGNVVYYRVE
jgi:hypothetical protein